MDRNLGAIITGYDGHSQKNPSNKKGIRGLYYQFGRKDPFQTITISIPHTSDTQQSYAYSVNNPDIFFEYTGDWHTPSNTSYPWNGSSNDEKSLYDPCPAGWRVPAKELWSDFTTSNFKPSGYTYLGQLYYDIAWYPYAGCRYFSESYVKSVGSLGHYWSSNPDSDRATRGINLYFYAPDVYPKMDDNRAYGFPVRCVQE